MSPVLGCSNATMCSSHLLLTAEILELAGNAARDNKKGRVTPRHILLAVANDEELNQVRGSPSLPPNPPSTPYSRHMIKQSCSPRESCVQRGVGVWLAINDVDCVLDY